MIRGFRLGDTEGFYLLWDGKDTGALRQLTGPYFAYVRDKEHGYGRQADGCACLRLSANEISGSIYAPVGSVIVMKDTDAESGMLLPPLVVRPEIEWAVKMFTE